MIKIHARDDRSAEHEAAQQLARLAVQYDPDLESSTAVSLEIFPSAQCFGQKTRDIDLLVFYGDFRGADRKFTTSRGRKVQSLCVTIEVKGHQPHQIEFQGAKCSVRYNGELHDVTAQSESQKFSLRNYIKNQPKRPRPPWIINLIWLTRMNTASLPQATSNIIGMDVTWRDFLEKCALMDGGDNHGKDVATFFGRAAIRGVTEIFSKELQASRIDRKKLEGITRSVLDRQQYMDKLGSQLLIFRGRGGTGKTVRLLQLAYQSYTAAGLRVLILTYNKALMADIHRLLKLLGTKQVVGGQSLTINSIYSFMHRWLSSLEIIEKEQSDFLENYQLYKQQALEMIESGAITASDIELAKERYSADLRWDLVLIDECQDWPANERDLLYRLYGAERFVIADGVDQLVRGTEVTDWRQGTKGIGSQVVPLHKSLRLKASLCQAVTHFADEIDFSHWRLEPVHEAQGGKVIVVSGDGLSEDLYRKLTDAAKKDGNEAIDILTCVPPSWVVSGVDGRKCSVVAEKMRQWGYDVWDAVDPENREAYPTSVSQYRIVQYESCRGLEGWTVVCFGLDQFYEHKLKNADISDESRGDLFFDEGDTALSYAKKWLMIPLTRAIDTLVVHVSSEESNVGLALRELHRRYPSDVIWESAQKSDTERKISAGMK
ncbi:hypothetical protein V6R86_10715 [Sphingomonas kaistensis]|uniref:DNA helicase n=1 Tax=Sphingomonas kaistensis TaxID=298708 RepID=A0ABZ2G3Y5_9SPHN